MSEMIERELGWDDQIENEGADFVLLPEGNYDFEVTTFERGRFNGSEKMPPCNQANLIICITATNGQSTTVKKNLLLHSKVEWKLCEFFTSIGQRKKGEKVSMNWNAVVGSRGRCEVTIRNWKKDDGTPMQSNEIKKFLEPVEGQQTGLQWKAGSF